MYVQYLNEVKDSITAAFYWGSLSGILAEEPQRGVRYDIRDLLVHTDPLRRGAGQIIPTARRVMKAAQWTANPRLMEPVYLVEIQCPYSVIANVFSVINQRNGIIIEEQLIRGVGLATVKCYLPVTMAFGLHSELSQNTGGQCLVQCAFDYWKVMEDSPWETGTRSEEIVTSLRLRKGLKPEIPPLENFLDKL